MKQLKKIFLPTFYSKCWILLQSQMLIIIVMLFLNYSAMGQVSGTQTVTLGDQTTYSFNNGYSYAVANWIPAGLGTIVSKSNSGLTYYVTVLWNKTGNGPLEFRDSNYDLQGSLTIFVHSPSDGPAVPTNLTATTVSSSQINLAWTDNSSDETAFNIERSLTSGTGFSLLTSTGPNVTSYSDGTVTSGKTYYYRIRAVKATGQSVYTPEASATAAGSPPNAPSGLAAATVPLATDQLNLTWTDNSSNEAGFEIHRSLTSGSGYYPVGSTGPNAVSFSDYNLSEGTKYYYVVRAANDVGSSSFTSEASATTVPAAPTNLVVAQTGLSTSLALTWTDNSNGETGYQIERATTSSGPFSIVTTTSPSQTYYVNTGLTANTTYYYRVAATYVGGITTYATVATGTATITAARATQLQTYLTSLAFQYQYDTRSRMVSKQVPGAGVVYMVYDNLDRLVMTQDANQRPNKQWTFTKYDALNRPIMTGIYTHTAVVDQPTMSGLISTTNFFEAYNGASATHGYTTNVWPTSNYSVLTVTYYDNYNFVIDLALGTDYNYAPGELSGQEPLANISATAIGHPTGSKVNVLGSPSNFLYSVNYFDKKYRTIQTTAQNNKAGWDRTTSVVDFTGRVLNTKTTHRTNTHADVAVSRRLQYDHAGRLLRTFHQVNSNPEVLLSQNTYNEIGQLIKKDLHCTNCTDPLASQSNTTPGGAIVRTAYNSNEQILLGTQSILLEPGYYVPNGSSLDAKVVSSNATIPGGGGGGTYMQSVDYRYNIRGWLQSMNDSQLTSDINDLFGFELAYNTPFTTGTTTGNTPYFNGNISAMKWSSSHGTFLTGFGADVAYNYTYDAMNRITGASYLRNTNGWSNASGAYNESGYSYDLNGNIKTLLRKGSTGNLLDSLYYGYGSAGNQLLKVKDSGDKTKGFVDGANTSLDYTYDSNGNLITDQNKSLTAANAIQYNYLNLPQQVTKSTNEKIIYTYDASGRKLMQQVYNAAGALTKTTDYDGEFIYQGDTLRFINHEEGRIVMKGVTNPEYQYHLKDHLGNVRLTFTSQITTKKFKAGFEVADQTTEVNNFSNYQTNKINTLTPTNPNATTGNSAYYLNGGYTGQVGVAKSLSVMPGDVVSIQASAKYNTPSTTPTNFTPFVTSLLAAFNLTPPAPGEVGTPAVGVNTFGNWEIGATGDESKSDAMKIFVTIIMFDRNYNFLDVAYKAIQGSGSSASATYTAKQPGYAYLYISNEHPYLTDVYFDDVTITFTPSPVVQQEDFYPFGLTFNSYSRENSVKQDYLYNGKELQDELGLNWEDYGARMYMPELGKFFSIDLLSEKFSSQSPYAYAANNPIKFIDVMGLGPGDPAPGELSSKNCKCATLYTKPADESYNIKVKAPDGTYHTFEQADGFHFTYSDGKFHDNQQKKAGVWSVTSHGENYMWDNVEGKYVKNTSNKGGGENSFIFGESILIGESAGTTYAGGDNPRNIKNKKWNYSQPSQNAADHVGYVHDKGFDDQQIEGFSGVMSQSSTPANLKLIASALQVVRMYSAGAIDPYTGAKVSKKTADTAARMAILFMIVEKNKQKQ